MKLFEDDRFEEEGRSSELRAQGWENELCSVKLLAMHRPTHDPEREKVGKTSQAKHRGFRVLEGWINFTW